MSVVCDTSCGAVALPTGLNKCDLDAIITSGDRFVFINCTKVWTDITDPAEWAAAKTAGDVVCSPPGFWSKGLPSQTEFSVACGIKIQVQEGQTFEFESSLMDKDGLTDQDFWKSIRDNFLSYYVIPVSCDGQFLISDAYLTAITAAGESPGHSFSWIQPVDYVIEQGDNQLMKWQGSIHIPTSGIICRRYLPGVLAAICD